MNFDKCIRQPLIDEYYKNFDFNESFELNSSKIIDVMDLTDGNHYINIDYVRFFKNKIFIYFNDGKKSISEFFVHDIICQNGSLDFVKIFDLQFSIKQVTNNSNSIFGFFKSYIQKDYKEALLEYYEKLQKTQLYYDENIQDDANAVLPYLKDKYGNMLESIFDESYISIFASHELFLNFLHRIMSSLFILDFPKEKTTKNLIINSTELTPNINLQNEIEPFLRLFIHIMDNEPTRNKNAIAYAYFKLCYENIVIFCSNFWLEQFGQKKNIDEYCNGTDYDPNSTFNANLFLFYLIDKDYYNSRNYLKVYPYYVETLLKKLESNKQNLFIKNLDSKHNKTSNKQEKVTIDEIDMMTGKEFENFIANFFTKQGYSTSLTKASGDQGIDVLIEKNGIKTGIQLKCYSGTVGNSAIQEACAAKSFYKCNKVMVITNSHFSKSAKELARANNVILWDRDILKDKLSSI